MDASDLSVNMQKWGIPEKEMVSAEITLLERLVWVPYKDHWWPALLYENYTELQAHLYEELDMVLKAQFAVAIMREMNDSKQIKVARLLGREVLEVVEVDDNQHAEFYWQLPKVLPMACKKSRYGNDTKLYIDFHRALDEVEEIIRDISKNSFNLIPNEEKKTWVERAEEALQSSNTDTSTSTSVPKKQRRRPSSNNSLLHEKVENKAATDKEESNFLFNALDGMMDKINTTYDCVSGDVSDMTLETSTAKKKVEIIQKTPIDAHSDALLKQKEYRAALRNVIAKQRQCRISDSNSSRSSNSNDEARNPSSDGNGVLRKSNSAEILPGFVLGLNNDEPEQPPDEIAQSRSYSRQKDYISSVPELRIALPKKSMNKNNVAQTLFMTPTSRKITMAETRDENPVDDREAIKAAARAAAAVDLDMSFWDHMTCHTLDS
ncbi:MAG: hypothetical protein ACI8RD_006910 [Bacillariaceae sp.]|jgi:hypothetical protein